MKASLFSSLLFIPLVLATIGDVCRSGGERGTCQKVSKCSGGFTVTGACPNDPADVKCCIKKGCQKPQTSLQGSCLDKDQVGCSGGSFIQGQCPGATNVQCCIKNAAPAPAPAPKPATPAPKPAPNCPAVRHDFGTLGAQNFFFSRSSTDKFSDAAGLAGKGAAACAAIAAISEVGVPIAVVCGLGGIGLDILSDHAKECHDKKQCLKITLPPLTTLPIPFCVGGNECCG